jgi:phosphorylcholine metabolism protein LicD
MTDLAWERGWRKGKIGENKEVVLNNLIDFKKVMDKYKISFFLIWGTLLGAVRDKDFIYWDDDIDVGGFWLYRYSRKFLAAVEELEHKYGFYVARENTPAYDSVFIRDGEKIEIWWFEKMDNIYIYDPKRVKNVWYPYYHFRYRNKINFFGHEFDIPSEVERFLRVTYSHDWMNPNPNGIKNNAYLRNYTREDLINPDFKRRPSYAKRN